MLNERTVAIATGFWAAHFGCPAPELFAEPFRIVTHGRDLADYQGAFALFRDGSVIASIPPDRADAFRALLSIEAQRCSPNGFASALSAFSAAVVGPAFIGYAAKIAQPAHSAHPTPQACAIGPGDAARWMR